MHFYKKTSIFYILIFIILSSVNNVLAYKNNHDLIKIYINGNFAEKISKESVLINESNSKLCFPYGKLTSYGISIKYIKTTKNEKDCIDFPKGTTLDFIYYNNTLSIIVPDYYLLFSLQENTTIFSWDEGIPGALINYNTNISKFYDHENKQSYNDYYLQIKPQLNFNAWRIHSSFSLQKNENWQRNYIYAERGINSLRSRLFFGELESNSEIFDNYSFTGVQLSSDELMVPYESWAYSPIVKGIAKTTAKVIISQNNQKLTELTVLPGPFEITNIPMVDPFGELHVTVIESDRTEHSFYVPYNIPSLALREGAKLYNISAGFYRSSDEIKKEIPVIALNFKYGLPMGITAYGGTQLSSHYQSIVFGSNFTAGLFGDISADISTSTYNTKELNKQTGSKIGFKYKKDINKDNTINIYSEKVLSPNYQTLNEHISSYRENYTLSDYLWHRSNQQRYKVGLSINKNLNENGNLNISLSTITNENGYSNKYFDINYNLNLWSKILTSFSISRNTFKNESKHSQTIYNILINYPINNESNTINTSYQYTAFPDNTITHEIGMYGSILNNRLSFDIRERYDEILGLDNTIMLSYQNKKGELSGYYNNNRNYRQLGYSMSGGIFVSKYSLNLSRGQGDAFAILNIPNINKDDFYYYNDIELDKNNNSFIDYLQPYQKNTLNLPSLDGDKHNTLEFTPTKGAFVYVTTDKHLNKKQRVNIKISDSTIAPLGTIVSSQENINNSAIVNEYGEAYLLINEKTKKFQIQWGKEKHQQCIGKIILKNKNRETQSTDVVCLSP